MSAFTVRLPDDVAKRLDKLAEKLDRSRSYVAAQAISDFVTREAWQLADIEAGLREAERGEFASDAEVAATIARFTKRKRRR
ncbi:MAG: ribbon-helix-helix protein, CopG family [Rhodospirillales bacterium]|nr:ribbon-helix-helix protein, CopG family [Rhodospirillales bacterium]